VTALVKKRLLNRVCIPSILKLQADLENSVNMHIPVATLRRIMKKRLGLIWKKIKRVASPGNSERNRVLRHIFARKILPLYASNEHIVNIDESWISVSDFGRQIWNMKGSDNNHHDNVLGNKVNLLVAVSS